MASVWERPNEELKEKLRKAGEAFYEESADQLKEAMKSLFKSMDRNGDGVVSLDELHQACKSHPDPFFSSIVATDLPFIFSLLDTDGDYKLDFHESKALYFLVSSRVFCYFCQHLILHKRHRSCLRCQHHICSSCDHHYSQHFLPNHHGNAHEIQAIADIFTGAAQQCYNHTVQCMVCGDLHQRMVCGFTGLPKHIHVVKGGYMCEWCETWRCEGCDRVFESTGDAHAYRWFNSLRCQNCLSHNIVLGIEPAYQSFLKSPTMQHCSTCRMRTISGTLWPFQSQITNQIVDQGYIHDRSIASTTQTIIQSLTTIVNVATAIYGVSDCLIM